MLSCVPDSNEGADCFTQNLSWLREQSALLLMSESLSMVGCEQFGGFRKPPPRVCKGGSCLLSFPFSIVLPRGQVLVFPAVAPSGQRCLRSDSAGGAPVNVTVLVAALANRLKNDHS